MFENNMGMGRTIRGMGKQYVVHRLISIMMVNLLKNKKPNKHKYILVI